MEWDESEMKEFRRLVAMVDSLNQMSRIVSRLELPKFVEQHGKEKCNAMFKEICREDDNGK